MKNGGRVACYLQKFSFSLLYHGAGSVEFERGMLYYYYYYYF